MRSLRCSGIAALAWSLCAASAAGAQESSLPQPPQPPQLEDVWQSRADYRDNNFEELVRQRLAKSSALRGFELSPAERKALRDLEVAAASVDPAKRLSALAAAQKVVVSPDAKFVLGALQMQIGAKNGDAAVQAAGTDLVIESGVTPPAVLPKLLRNQGTFALDANDLVKAEAAFGKLVELSPADADSAVALAQIKADLRKDQEALKLFEQAIAAKTAAGQQVPPIWVRAADATRRRVAAAAGP